MRAVALCNRRERRNPALWRQCWRWRRLKSSICVRQFRIETGRIVVLANDNCPGQAVVSGDIEAVERLIALASEAGARRAVKLSVSVAAHSPLMSAALEGFLAAVQATSFSTPTVPVYSNVRAEPLLDEAAIRTELNHQLTQSVRWTESMRAIIAAGAETFIEVGAGNVLTGLLRRIDRSRGPHQSQYGRSAGRHFSNRSSACKRRGAFICLT